MDEDEHEDEVVDDDDDAPTARAERPGSSTAPLHSVPPGPTVAALGL